MEPLVKTVDMKMYRKTHLNFLSVMCLMAVASFLLVRNSIDINWNIAVSTITTDALLIGIIGLAILYSFYIRKQKEKMQRIENFEEKLAFHRRYYKIRLWWLLLSGATSCLLYVLTAYKFFFWFVLFDFLSLLLAFPGKFFFKRELNDDEIIFL
jgi:hypothetical protein